MAHRVILFHIKSSNPTIDLDQPLTDQVHGHCFGPFEDAAEAIAFDLQAPDDCVKLLVDLVGPSAEDALRAPDLSQADRTKLS